MADFRKIRTVTLYNSNLKELLKEINELENKIEPKYIAKGKIKIYENIYVQKMIEIIYI